MPKNSKKTTTANITMAKVVSSYTLLLERNIAAALM
jgi:hypothetical protein